MKIFLTGRIDATNAPELEQKISSELSNNEVPEFDAENLEYISSAGLRVLLKFRKQFNQKLSVVNVSNDVYNIFEVTGFTELLNVRKKLREISLEGCPIIGGGYTATVYRLDDETIAKVYDTDAPITLADIENEQKISRAVFVKDIPTAIAFDIVKAGGHYASIYEAINSDTIAGTVKKNPARLQELAIKAAKLFKKIHRTEMDAGSLPDIREKHIVKLNRLEAEKLLTPQEKNLLLKINDTLRPRKNFLHMDFHMKNLMLMNDEIVLIDVGTAAIGDPVIDVSHTFFVLSEFPKIAETLGAEFQEKYLPLPIKIMLPMWEIFRCEYFETTDPEKLSRYEKILHGYALFEHVMITGLNGNMPYDRTRGLIESYLRELSEFENLKPIDAI